MRDTVKVDWRVPSAEWDRFVEHVREEFGTTENGYLGREAELAMREYADADGYEAVEKQIDRLVRAAGRTPGRSVREKNSLANTDKTRVSVRVSTDIKDAFKAVAKDADDPYGVEFARALRTYRDGGRAARLERKVDRIADDAEKLLGHVNDDSDEKLSAVERRTIAACNYLDKTEFKEDELVEAIEEGAEAESDPSIEKYRKRVTERLDVEPHPANPELYVPSEKVAELTPDGQPAETRRPVEFLDEEQLIDRLVLMAGLDASRDTDGMARLSYDRIRTWVYDAELQKSKAKSLTEAATKMPGFTIETINGNEKLQVNLPALQNEDPELMKQIVEYREAMKEQPASPTTPDSTLDDYGASKPVMTDGSGDD